MESLSFLSPNPYNDTLSYSSDCGSDYMFDTTPIENRNTQTTKPEKKSAKKTASFIEKLYRMLEDNTHSDLISWTPSGTSFVVRNAKVFAAQVLPTHFKHSNFSSFVRLLNMQVPTNQSLYSVLTYYDVCRYGFHKISKSPRGQRSSENEILEFSHSHFIRDRADLLNHVNRKTMDPESMRRGSSDLRASLETLQTSQSELIQQFHALQETYTKVLHGLEESRKIQRYQEMQIRQLSEHQPHENRQQGSFQMMVTTPGNSIKTPHSPFPPPTPPILDINNNSLPETQQQWDDFFSPLSFQVAANTPLPPSPMLLTNPDLPMESPRGSSEESMGSYSFSLPDTLDTTFI